MSSAAEFWSLVRRDAALQAKVEAAAKKPDPARAIQQVAADSGFDLTIAALQTGLEGELTDHDLSSVAGGFSDKEWFAEQFTAVFKGRG